MPFIESWRPETFEADNRQLRTGSSRCFGVELEYERAPEYRSYRALAGKVFGCKPDGSTSGPEFYSPIISGDKGLEACEALCDFGLDKGFETPEGTGYHLHMDMRSESTHRIKSIATAFHHTHELWTGFVPQHRKESMWCRYHDWNAASFRPLQTDRDLRNMCGGSDRYCWLNWAAYNDHGTCEMRIHESTTDKAIVTNWIVACLKFVDAAADMTLGQITRIFGSGTRSHKFKELAMMLQDHELSDYLRSRYNRYTSRAVN